MKEEKEGKYNEILSDVVNYLLSLGAAIFVPIIIIIAGLIVSEIEGCNIRRYYTRGSVYRDDDADQFYDGGNFTGCGSDAENTGISLPIVDGGWTTMSTIFLVLPYAFLMFPLMIVINIIMLVIKNKYIQCGLMECLG